MAKVSLSNSPLAHPASLIYQIASEAQDYLYLPDPSPLYIVLAALAANIIQGQPVWLMLIGPSSCGKGEILNSLMGIPRVARAESISGEAALISGVNKKDRERKATGGLLREIGDRGALIMEDFTSSVEGMGYEKKNELLNAFRQIYNGSWSRAVGSGGGKREELGWVGKLAFLAGGTHYIDQLHGANASLGERWLYYRFAMDGDDGYGAARKAINNTNPQKNRKALQELIRSFFDMSNLDWDQEEERRELTGMEYHRLIDIATVVSRIRSSTIRDRYTREHEIVDVVQKSELPARLAAELGQLYLGLERIEVNESERWKLIYKVATDSAPRIRMLIVETVMAMNGTGTGMGYLQKATGCSLNAVKRAIEDLEVHTVLEQYGGMVHLTKWARENLNKMGRWEVEESHE